MSKIMRQLIAEGRAARESQLKALGHEKKVPEPTVSLPICPKTFVACDKPTPCTGICVVSWTFVNPPPGPSMEE